MTPLNCHGVLIADRYIGTIVMCIVYTMLGINFLVTVPLLWKRDDFGVIWVRTVLVWQPQRVLINYKTQENLICIAVLTPSVLFVFSEMFPDNGGLLDWYLDGLNQNYSPGFLFMFIMAWSVMLMVLGFPLVLYLLQTVNVRQDAQQTFMIIALNASVVTIQY